MGITAALKVIFLLFGRVTGGNLLTSGSAGVGWGGRVQGRFPPTAPARRILAAADGCFLARGLSERGETWEEPSWIVD